MTTHAPHTVHIDTVSALPPPSPHRRHSSLRRRTARTLNVLALLPPLPPTVAQRRRRRRAPPPPPSAHSVASSPASPPALRETYGVGAADVEHSTSIGVLLLLGVAFNNGVPLAHIQTRVPYTHVRYIIIWSMVGGDASPGISAVEGNVHG